MHLDLFCKVWPTPIPAHSTCSRLEQLVMALKHKVDTRARASASRDDDSSPSKTGCDVTRALADVYDTSADVDPDTAANVNAKPLSWDERRKLALDIANLAPPDLPGVLLLAHTFASNDSDSHDGKARSAGMTQCEFAPPRITEWDATTAHIAPPSDVVTSTSNSSPLQLECGVDLDSAHPELLHRLRTYVDSCYVPHYVPKENCSICEGLWSSGRVIACGNDACETRIHEECFGVVLRETPDGPWCCPSCLLGRQLLCSVCMQYGGALKPLAPPATTTSSSSSLSIDDVKWVHTLCAMAIPELVMRDVPSMEPVDGFDEIENGRFRYLCGICRKRGGASIICDFESCNVGMHPFCAGNAGLMVGTEANALAVFCEKHLPASRVMGAKRLISDEDLVEEIVSETNSIEDEGADDVDDKLPAPNDTQRYAFILASTPSIAERAKLLGDRTTLKWGSHSASSRSTDLRAKSVESARRPVAAWSMQPDAGGWKTRRPIMFPPPAPETGAKRRVGIAPFPAPAALVGAIVDLSAKPQDAWVRARVLEYDPSKRLHRVQLIATSQAVWTPLSIANALVLHLPRDTNVLDGPRVRLVRAVTHGEAHWRPKPRLFEPPAPSS